LPGVRAEGLDIAAIAFCIEHFEGQGRLAGPRHTGHRSHFAHRHADVDAFQVVLTSAFDEDER
jgi:hypothetical protein